MRLGQCEWCDSPHLFRNRTDRFCSRNCKGQAFYWKQKINGTGRGTAVSRLEIRTCLGPSCNIRFRPRHPTHIYCSHLCGVKAEYWRNHDRRLSVIKANRSQERVKKRISESGKKYRHANKRKIAKYTATWRAAHPEVQQAREGRYRQIKRGLVPFVAGTFTGIDWVRLKLKYNHSCAYCHRRVSDLTQDHVIPLSKGGEHTLSNIVPACRRCNGVKADRDLDVFLEQVKAEGWPYEQGIGSESS